MENVRIKFLLILNSAILILAIWCTVTNTYSIGIGAAKEMYLQNNLNSKLNQTNDPETLRRLGLELLNMMKIGAEETDRVAGQVQLILIFITLVTFMSLINVIMEIARRRKNRNAKKVFMPATGD